MGKYIISIKQTKKDLFSAEFDIIQDNNKVGYMKLIGYLGTREGNWEINFLDYNIKTRKAPGLSKTKRFRKQNIFIDDLEVGNIYQTCTGNWFNTGIDYHYINLNNREYELYPIGLGKEVKSPLYSEGKQVALIKKDLLVYDCLNIFDIYAIDKQEALISVLMCAYMYLIAYYEPGKKMIKSVQKGYSLTKNEELIQKYNPEFEKMFEIE